MKVGNLKRLRIDLGITLGKAAEDMKLSRQTLYNIENGAVTKESTLNYYELYLKDVRRRREYATERRDYTKASAV